MNNVFLHSIQLVLGGCSWIWTLFGPWTFQCFWCSDEFSIQLHQWEKICSAQRWCSKNSGSVWYVSGIHSLQMLKKSFCKFPSMYLEKNKIKWLQQAQTPTHLMSLSPHLQSPLMPVTPIWSWMLLQLCVERSYSSKTGTHGTQSNIYLFLIHFGKSDHLILISVVQGVLAQLPLYQHNWAIPDQTLLARTSW